MQLFLLLHYPFVPQTPEEQASIKSLIAMDVTEEEDRSRLNDHLAGMRLEEVQERETEKEMETQHEGMGLLLYHNRIFVYDWY
jgi:hypothetical protein